MSSFTPVTIWVNLFVGCIDGKVCISEYKIYSVDEIFALRTKNIVMATTKGYLKKGVKVSLRKLDV